MSTTCRQSRVWLHRTAQSWIVSSCRFKSTTSAIKQGLRATQKADGERPRGRDRGRFTQGDGGFQDRSSAFKRKDTAPGEGFRSSRQSDGGFQDRDSAFKWRDAAARDGFRSSRQSDGGFQDRSSAFKRRDSAPGEGFRSTKQSDGGLEERTSAFRRRDATSEYGSRSTRAPKNPMLLATADPAGLRSLQNKDPSSRKDGSKSKIKKFTSEGERPGSSDNDFWIIEELERSNKELVDRMKERDRIDQEWMDWAKRTGVKRNQNLPPKGKEPELPSWEKARLKSLEDGGSYYPDGSPVYLPGTGSRPPTMRHRVDRPTRVQRSSEKSTRNEVDGKLHPELYKIISKLAPLVVDLKPGQNSSDLRLRTHMCLNLVKIINQKMVSGEWTKRYVRNALNDLEEKVHFWDTEAESGKRKTGLLFDYENARLALVMNGEVVEPKRRDDSQPKAAQKEEKMFEIDSPPQTTTTQPRMEVEDEDIPLSIPYTTAASVFLYGTNTVLACLKAKRRKVYKLYLRSSVSDRDPTIQIISKLASEAGIRIQNNQDLKFLDKLSDGRPHNGVVLETSLLPAPPVLALGKQDDTPTNNIPLTLAPQSAEDTEVNGAPDAIPFFNNNKEGSNPLIILLDGITDPGNLGTILRTSYFYNVSAVAIATNTCAPVNSPVVAKASSGACEAIPILALPKPSNFVFASAKAGWKVYAAVAPEGDFMAKGTVRGRSKPGPGGGPGKPWSRPFLSASQLTAHAPLSKDPCILMLGAEGEGLRDILKRRADFFVSIDSGRRRKDGIDVGVDSLNVSAAAGVLVDAFMRAPAADVKGVQQVSSKAEPESTERAERTFEKGMRKEKKDWRMKVKEKKEKKAAAQDV